MKDESKILEYVLNNDPTKENFNLELGILVEAFLNKKGVIKPYEITTTENIELLGFRAWIYIISSIGKLSEIIQEEGVMGMTFYDIVKGEIITKE